MTDNAVSLSTILNSPGALEKWKTDPLGCFEDAGISLANFSPEAKAILTKHLASADPKDLASSEDCIVCRIKTVSLIGGLGFATLFALGAATAATDGADAPALPAEFDAALQVIARAIAAANGLAEAVVLEAVQAAVAAWWASLISRGLWALAGVVAGGAVWALWNDIAGRVCKLSGDCP
jgi:hypothetical protein